jgi:hypothetical protein
LKDIRTSRSLAAGRPPAVIARYQPVPSALSVAGFHGPDPVGELLREEVEEPRRVGAGVLQHDVVEADVELLDVLDVRLDVRAHGELLGDVVGTHRR